MGILSRFKEVMTSNVHAWLDRAEDPEKTIDEVMRKVNQDLSQLKAEAASVTAAEQRAKRAWDACKTEMSKLQRYAEKSVESGNDAGAMRFLDMKAQLANKETRLQAAYQAAAADAKAIRKMQDKLEHDVRELEERRRVLKEKLSITKAQQSKNGQIGTSNSDRTVFDEAEEKVNMAYYEAEALAELRAEQEDDLDEAFAQLEREQAELEREKSAHSPVDELAAIKASIQRKKKL